MIRSLILTASLTIGLTTVATAGFVPSTIRHADGLLTPALKSWKARIDALPYFSKTIPPHWQQS